MNRKEITALLSELLEEHINKHNDPRIYLAKEVTFDYATSKTIRVDYMRFKPTNNSVSGIEKGDFYCYEIKSSVADFKSKNGHNLIGDLNYYVMPEEVYNEVEKLINYKVGVIVMNEREEIYVKKNAKRQDRTKATSEMLLMMFRSAMRDVVKTKIRGEL